MVRSALDPQANARLLELQLLDGFRRSNDIDDLFQFLKIHKGQSREYSRQKNRDRPELPLGLDFPGSPFELVSSTANLIMRAEEQDYVILRSDATCNHGRFLGDHDVLQQIPGSRILGSAMCNAK